MQHLTSSEVESLRRYVKHSARDASSFTTWDTEAPLIINIFAALHLVIAFEDWGAYLLAEPVRVMPVTIGVPLCRP